LAVHLHTDGFYTAIRKGYIAPYMPEARTQNEVVIGAIAAAALGYARGGYEVFVDGIVGPWFLAPFEEACAVVPLDYVVLRPSQEETVKRGLERSGKHALRDEGVIRAMWNAFSSMGRLGSHVLDTTGLTAEATAGAIREGRDAGRFRLRGG
jgi:hypothetical protein